MSPETCVALLRALDLTLTPLGDAEHVLTGDAQGGDLLARYRPGAPLSERLTVRFRRAGLDGPRVLRRGDFPGWPVGDGLGDPAFDAEFAVVADAVGRVLLRAPVRGLVGDWLRIGGWVGPYGLGIDALALVGLSEAAALEAMAQLVRLGRLLFGTAPIQLVTQALHDPAPGVRDALPAFVAQAIEAGSLHLDTYCQHAARLGLPSAWRPLARVARPTDPAALTALVEAVVRLSDGADREADGWLFDTVAQARGAGAARAIAAIIDRALDRLAAGDHRVDERLLELVRAPAVLAAWATAAVRRDVRAAAVVFRQISVSSPGDIACVADALGSLGSAEDLPWLVSQLDHGAPQVSVAVERAVLDLVPEGLAAGGAPRDALGDALARGGSTARSMLEVIRRLPRPLPAGTAALLEARWLTAPTALLIEAIAATGDPAATPSLAEALTGPSAVAAAEVLAAIGDGRALPALRAQTGFFVDGDLRAACRAAIEAIEGRAGAVGGLSLSEAGGGGLSPVDD